MFSGPARMFDPEDPAAEHFLESVAITVHDGGDGFFHMEDSLVFYGRGLWNWNSTPDSLYRSPHRYDNGNTYWLTWGADDGERITAVNAEPSGGTPVEQGVITIGFEEEVFFSHQGNRTGWLWGYSPQRCRDTSTSVHRWPPKELRSGWEYSRQAPLHGGTISERSSMA